MLGPHRGPQRRMTIRTTAASGRSAAVEFERGPARGTPLWIGRLREDYKSRFSYRNLTGLTRLRTDRGLLCSCRLETWTKVEPSPAASRSHDRETLRPVQAGHDQPLPVACGRACLADAEGIRSAPLPGGARRPVG